MPWIAAAWGETCDVARPVGHLRVEFRSSIARRHGARICGSGRQDGHAGVPRAPVAPAWTIQPAGAGSARQGRRSPSAVARPRRPSAPSRRCRRASARSETRRCRAPTHRSAAGRRSRTGEDADRAALVAIDRQVDLICGHSGVTSLTWRPVGPIMAVESSPATPRRLTASTRFSACRRRPLRTRRRRRPRSRRACRGRTGRRQWRCGRAGRSGRTRRRLR